MDSILMKLINQQPMVEPRETKPCAKYCDNYEEKLQKEKTEK